MLILRPACGVVWFYLNYVEINVVFMSNLSKTCDPKNINTGPMF
jgi:hypothetical protein